MGRYPNLKNETFLNVEFCDAPQFNKKQRKRRQGSKYAGIKYEEKVNAKLRKLFGKQYVKSPWIRYQLENSKPRLCQPDGILIDSEAGIVTIVECKLSYTADAWYQINEVYAPVLKAFTELNSKEYKVRGVQVFARAVPQLVYPEKPVMITPEEIGKVGWESGDKICLWKI